MFLQPPDTEKSDSSCDGMAFVDGLASRNRHDPGKIKDESPLRPVLSTAILQVVGICPDIWTFNSKSCKVDAKVVQTLSNSATQPFFCNVLPPLACPLADAAGFCSLSQLCLRMSAFLPVYPSWTRHVKAAR